jgi:hypothetical protein
MELIRLPSLSGRVYTLESQMDAEKEILLESGKVRKSCHGFWKEKNRHREVV